MVGLRASIGCLWSSFTGESRQSQPGGRLLKSKHRIALIPGDGIGKEVVPAGREVLEALAACRPHLDFEFEGFEWGGDYYRRHGVMMPVDGLDALRNKDAILFGSAGDPAIAAHIT